jgi:hypothetical protein
MIATLSVDGEPSPVARAGLRHQFPPLRSATQPRTGEDLRRGLAWTLLNLGASPDAARLGLYFPALAVCTYVHVTTATWTSVPVPPVALDSHPLTV